MLTNPQRDDNRSKDIRSQSTFLQPTLPFSQWKHGRKNHVFLSVLWCDAKQRPRTHAPDGLYLSSVKKVISSPLLRVTYSRPASYVTHSTSTRSNSWSKLQKFPRVWKPIECFPGLIFKHPTHNSMEEGSSTFPSMSPTTIVCLSVWVSEYVAFFGIGFAVRLACQ